jgi:serine-aspartate repeat-containing protein C/D/E
MNAKQHGYTHKLVALAVFLGFLLALAGLTSIEIANAQPANLTVQILSWDKFGIDKINPETVGPNETAIQVRICNTGGSNATNVTVNFTWNSTTNQEYIYLASQLSSKVKNVGTLEPGKCTDVFYIVGVNRTSSSVDKTRAYTINVTSDQSNKTASQTLTVVGLQTTNSVSSTPAGITDSTPPKCTTFQIYVWDNVTDNANEIAFPIHYDPWLVELVSVSVMSWDSSMKYIGTFSSLKSNVTGKSYHYVTYTFHALNPGTTTIRFIIQERVSVPYKYNTNYDSVTVTLEVTLYLGDYVWEDMNYNGIQDAGEPGIANVIVNLSYYDNSTYIRNTTTDATGYYLFDDLRAANYTLRFVAPANYYFTKQNAGTNTTDNNANETGWTAKITTLYGGNNDVSWDAGLYRLASLGDYVWDDQNANGVQDPGTHYIEVPVTVNLYNSSGKIKNTTTNATGCYNFTNLTPGSYYVEFVKPVDYYFSPQDNGFDDAKDSDANTTTGTTDWITLRSGEQNMTIDAGLFQGAGLGSFVWEDLNANGIQDEGEPGIGNVTVMLYNDSAFSVLLNTTTTYVGGNDTGYYGFGNLTPNRTYYILFVPPNGSYFFSPQYQGGDDRYDSNANRTTGETEANTPASGHSNLTIDAGMYRLASLGDYVWKDQNANGIQDPGLTPFPGVNVTLYNSTKVEIANTTTNGTGCYNFTNLTPGGYYVNFSLPDGWEFSRKDSGDNDTIDSDANVTTGWTDLINLTSGEQNMNIDAGLHQGTGLGDFVWEDYNANGIQDDGEPGINVTVTVRLYNATSHENIANTSTNGGYYGFGNLTAVTTYYIKFELPDGYVFSPRYVGTYENDSNANETGWTEVITTPASGRSNLTIDAGMWRPASVGDFVWNDSNCDGIQDTGELGVPDVNVSLYNSSGKVATTKTNSTGYYNFSGLTPGEYYLVFELPLHYMWTLQDQGENDSIDSDVSGLSFTGNFYLGYGETNLTLDAGLCRCYASLGDFVWLDCSNGYYDGIWHEGESGFPYGVNVSLWWENGTLVANTTTNDSGYYNFTNLDPGKYYLEFELPSGYKWTLKGQGPDDNIDSDVYSNGTTDIITLGSCDNALTWDAGLACSADLNITKTVDSQNVTAGAGGYLNYTLTVFNAGPSDALAVNVTDTLPENVSFNDATPGYAGPNPLVWTLPRVNASETVTIWVNVSVNSSAIGVLNNTVYLSSTTSDPVPENNFSYNLTQVNTSADLNITKTVDSQNVTAGAGGYLNYTLTVFNAGPSDALAVNVTDTLPENVSFNDATPGYAGPNPLVWTLPRVNASETVTIWVNVSVNSSAIGVLNNTVYLSSTTSDPVPENNFSYNLTQVNTSADLKIVKTDNPDPVIAGKNLTYTINVTNMGPSDALNVTVTDIISPDVIFHSANPAPNDSSYPTYYWNLSVLPAGSSAVITVNVTVKSPLDNQTIISNYVNATSDTSDPNSGNNQAVKNTTVQSAPILIITKHDFPDPVTANMNFTYTVIYENRGNMNATNVTIMDVYDANVTFVNATPAPDNGTDNTTWTIPTLHPDGEHYINITVNVKGTVTNGTVISNTVNITCDQGVEETDTEDTTVVGQVILAITKYDYPDPVEAGENLTYTIIFENLGNVTATGTVVNDTLPPEVTFISASPFPNDTYNNNHTLIWNIGELPTNVPFTITITVAVQIPLPDGYNLTNYVNITSSQGPGEDAEITTVFSAPVLEIIKLDEPDPVQAGSVLNYSIKVTNSGNANATNATITEVYDTNVTFISSDPSPDHDDGNNNTWAFPLIAVGEYVSLNITVSIPSSLANGIILGNYVNVTSEQGVTDQTWQNTTVNTEADLSINKTVDNQNVTAGAGGYLNYTLIVFNAGPSDALDVNVTDTLPEGITFIAASPDRDSGPNPLVWTLPKVNASETVTIWVNVSVNSSALGVLNNTVYLSSTTSDPVPENNFSYNLTQVNSSADLTITKTVDSQNVTAGAGGYLNYTLTVFNAGPSDAVDVNVTDTLPENVTLNAVSRPQTAGPNPLVWYFERVNASETVTIWVNVSVNSSALGTLNNTVYLTSTTYDPETGNNTDSEETSVNAPPVAVNDTASTAVDIPVLINVSANDTDSDGWLNLSSINITVPPQHGNVTVYSNGTVLYTPDPGYTGNDSFEYTIKDNENATSNTATVNITITAGELCISGFKLNQSTGTGIANWSIYVTNDNGGSWTDITDASGYWEICGLTSGIYNVTEERQIGWQVVDPPEGSYTINLTGDGNRTGLNFTNSECNGSISDFVWLDANQNGIQDSNESGIGGVEVRLYRHESLGTLCKETVTNGTGYYIFDKLCEGNYSLEFIPPPGYAFTQPNLGADDTRDSDIDPTTRRTDVFYLGSGEVNTTIDAGLYQIPFTEVPIMTPFGVLALLSLLSAVAALQLRRKRRG